MDRFEWDNILQTVWWDNSIQIWLFALLGFVVSWVFLGAIKRWLLKKLTALAKRTTTDLDDFVFALIKKTQTFLLFALSLYVSLTILHLEAKPQQIANGFLLAVLLLTAAIWGNTAISFFIKKLVENKLSEDASSATTVTILGFLGKLVLWSSFVLLVLDNFGIDITTLVAGLGIGGIAVALAAQNVLGDTFASIAIALDKPFVIGDFIIVDDYVGVIENIGLKTTRLRSLSGEQLVFANTDLLNSRIRNYKRMRERRIVFPFGVLYETPADKLEAIPAMVEKIITAEQHARFDRAHFKSYGDSSLDFEVVYYMLDPEYKIYMDTQQSINLHLFKQFAQEGIGFAYPTRTLYLHQNQN